MVGSSARQILLTFTGGRDPFSSQKNQPQTDGPILSLIGQKEFPLNFDGYILIHTPDFQTNAQRTCAEIRSRFSRQADPVGIEVPDPTDYGAILSAMRSAFGQIRSDCGKSEFTIFVSPGTSQMHACWLMLSASGEIPARRLLQLREKSAALPGQPLVVEHKVRALPSIPPRETAVALPSRADKVKIAEARKNIIGEHPLLLKTIEDAVRFADADGPILIRGETGTGKELLAKLIHAVSQRSENEFVGINCGAIAESLVESELFGHEKGAFTGAAGKRPGAFDKADEGTIFLDEIGDLVPQLQVKLLRVLQEGQVKPVGADEHHNVNVRIVSATHRDLELLLRGGMFREDLYYRLNMFEIHLPALRERVTDIGLIANFILENLNRQYGSDKKFISDALVLLQEHHWPGNVRELVNVVKRAYWEANDAIDSTLLSRFVKKPKNENLLYLPMPHDGFDMKGAIRRAESHLYDLALQMAGGVQTRAAKLLGVSNEAVSQHVKRKKSDQIQNSST
jgi:DNA-binding NtrC family response regulator